MTRQSANQQSNELQSMSSHITDSIENLDVSIESLDIDTSGRFPIDIYAHRVDRHLLGRALLDRAL